MRIVCFLALAICGLLAADAPQNPSIEQIIGDTDVMRAIRTAQSVQVWRLAKTERPAEKRPARPRPSAPGELNRQFFTDLQTDFLSVGDGVKFSSAETVRLREMLLSPLSYHQAVPDENGFVDMKVCEFYPVVRVLFFSAETKAEVWICFFCSELVFMSEQTARARRDITPVSRELLALVKSVLKDDPVIAKIPAR